MDALPEMPGDFEHATLVTNPRDRKNPFCGDRTVAFRERLVIHFPTFQAVFQWSPRRRARSIRLDLPFRFQVHDVLALVSRLSFTVGATIRLRWDVMNPWSNHFLALLTAIIALDALVWAMHVVSLNYRDEDRPWVRVCGYLALSAPVTVLWLASIHPSMPT
jgi:hypothetical protein